MVDHKNETGAIQIAVGRFIFTSSQSKEIVVPNLPVDEKASAVPLLRIFNISRIEQATH